MKRFYKFLLNARAGRGLHFPRVFESTTLQELGCETFDHGQRIQQANSASAVLTRTCPGKIESVKFSTYTNATVLSIPTSQ